MLPLKRPVLLSSLVALILLPLGACANSPWADNLERSFAADPQLEANPNIFGATQPSGKPGDTATLPANFPAEIPRYPNSTLVSVTEPDLAASGIANGMGQSTQTRWTTTDQPAQVEQFYREQFQSNGWQLESSAGDAVSGQPIIAKRDGLRVTVAIATPTSTTQAPASPSPTSSTPTSSTPTSPAPASPAPASPVPNSSTQNATEFAIDYQFDNNTATQLPSPVADAQSPIPKPGDPDFIGPVLPSEVASQPANPSPNAVNGQPFADLNQAPTELQPYITDLAKLGALKTAGNEFKPNQTLTRREYAKWLVNSYNLIYASQPARQIRLGSASDQPAFQDVPTSDPDFGAIQGLANAGLIPSPLSGDATTVTFRPDAPLTREDLLLWKVPLDTRQALPNATIDAVQQTWGFQDAAKIDPKALRAVLADFQNSDLSNIRRAFGYTTLFQPQKAVTRAEAAAALWYFGSQGSGLSAKDALQAKQPSANQPSGNQSATSSSTPNSATPGSATPTSPMFPSPVPSPIGP